MPPIIEKSELQRRLVDIIKKTRQLRDETMNDLSSQRHQAEYYQALLKLYPKSEKLPNHIAFFNKNINTEIELLDSIEKGLAEYEEMLSNSAPPLRSRS